MALAQAAKLPPLETLIASYILFEAQNTVSRLEKAEKVFSSLQKSGRRLQRKGAA